MERPESNQSRNSCEETREYVGFDMRAARFYENEPHELTEATVGAVTHAGKVRPINEDHYLVVRRQRSREVIRTSLPVELLEAERQQAYTLAVADGLGGRRFGELASFLALRTGWELGGSEVKWTFKLNVREVEELNAKAQVFFGMLHRALREAAVSEPLVRGMGTTLTIAYNSGASLFVMHVGDSRAYLFRGGQLERLTQDHTVAARMIREGADPASPAVAASGHILTGGLGGEFEEVDVDFVHQRLRDQDRVLLCTDGLTSMLSDEEITATLVRLPDPQAACDELLRQTLDRGAKDNVTVVIADYRVGHGETTDFPALP